MLEELIRKVLSKLEEQSQEEKTIVPKLEIIQKPKTVFVIFLWMNK